MAIIQAARQAGVYDIAGAFAEQAIARDGSILSRRRVWTAGALRALGGRLTVAIRDGEGSFDDRWAALLGDAPTETVRLAAEVLLVHLCFAQDLSGATKRRLISGTLGRLEDPPSLPGHIDAALDHGVARTGVAFKALRLSQLDFLDRAALGGKGLPAARRREVLGNPIACSTWLHDVPPQGGQAQREALLHLLHPKCFEPIVSPRVKERIIRAFEELVPAGVDDTDSALRAIRAALEPRHGQGFSFVDPAVASRWR